MAQQINKFDPQVLRRFSWFDTVIILVLFAGILISFPSLKYLTPGTVVVFKDNQVIAEYPLDQDHTFEIQGKKGVMKVKISDRSVFVHNSTCPHQICVRQGGISKPYNQIVCTPNHILITINAKKDDTLDAVTR